MSNDLMDKVGKLLVRRAQQSMQLSAVNTPNQNKPKAKLDARSGAALLANEPPTNDLYFLANEGAGRRPYFLSHGLGG